MNNYCNCLEIARGSTFDFTISLPEGYDISNAKQVWVTFEQHGEIVKNYILQDVKIDVNKISVHISQDDTLQFDTGKVKMQVRILTEDDESLVQEPILELNILPILKDGVIE